MAKICLDFGHGGKDSGAVWNGLSEKNIVLEIGTKITKILEQQNVEVINTRTSDVFVELDKRAYEANRVNADIFVSLHCNSFSNSQAQGIEVFSYPNSIKGKKLSQSILENIIHHKLYTKNRGLKTENFAVLRLTSMPSALVELGFITNAEDVDILINQQDELALSVARGILGYLDITYKETESDQYQKSLKTLVDQGIINTPSAWSDSTKIKPANARSLVIKVADYIQS